MDSFKHKSAALKKRCYKLHQRLMTLENKCQLARLRADAALKWSERLNKDSAELSEILKQLPKTG